MSMTAEQVTALRKPFPPEMVGKLPKRTKNADGSWGPTIHLDYVGHAAVTDRLLTVDPAWSWEPLALDEHGLPALDRAGNLWIKLTICGVTRLGVGDGKSAKECIGDAIRNAAMRFGVALDLWAKENLVEFANAAAAHQAALVLIDDEQMLELLALYAEADLADPDKALAVARWSAGRADLTQLDALTAVEAARLIAYLADRVANERRAAQVAAAQTPPAPEETPDHAA